MIEKDFVKNEFLKNPSLYWKVKVFDEFNFIRQKCKNCGKYFWSVVKKDFCNDGFCIDYKFLDFDKITKRKLNYIEVWKEVKDFFEKNNHTVLETYPVVCRWFPLNFTIAGIVNFYRLTKGKLDFEMPANPSLVNQICLRFNDLDNVGLNGRSYSCFGMINQQTIFYNKEGYWKDECIELDLNLLTKVFGINIELIDFIEDIWVGPAAFGPSLEYHVLGLELGNAVFTEFEVGFKPLEKKVIDMGAGWERFAWISSLKPTSYEVVFDEQLKQLLKSINIDYDEEKLKNFFKYTARINVDDVEDVYLELEKCREKAKIDKEYFEKDVKKLIDIFIILDHSRALLFALSDGAVLNNVGGGYNLRVLFRRTLDILKELKIEISIDELFSLHERSLKVLFPKIYRNKETIKRILEIEYKKYLESKKKEVEIIKKLKNENKTLSEEEILKLYDSHGINPILLKNENLIKEIPKSFYLKVSKMHEKEKKVEESFIEIDGIEKTEFLFYDKIYEFEAKVLKIVNDFVILDRTAFYPRAGGQEPDKGFINNCEVLDVLKQKDIVLHKLKNINFKEGDIVKCFVDKNRRFRISKNHAATHLINYVCRKLLGEHVWQHSAFKDEFKARLDIVHFENIDEYLLEKIEKEVNDLIEKNLPITVEILERKEAEKKYGFEIYQGGAIDEKLLRIVKVGFDIEACSGTHSDLSSTREIGFVRIFRAKKIQDGVVRLEFVAGESCLDYLREKEKILKECCDILKVEEKELPKKVKEIFDNWKKLRKIIK
ncbi:MAG: alanine--tRNA ligase-related protein [Candidatus Aenigmarchaeota archaeon]|nr:alanine--tRNA ligase-related protein [Candidatus Aenigmarchaeota archaeon]MDW8149325.1 alanine--tRNA ligase-related protein [Candidatus Aenigmarchaeota archaeon]